MNIGISWHFHFRVFWAMSGERSCSAFCPSLGRHCSVTKDRIPANGFVEGYPRSRSIRLTNAIKAKSFVQRGIRRHTSNLIRICRTRIVSINLLCCRALVEANEALEEILAGRIVVGAAIVVGEVVA
jgi:hypothetical protein